MKDDAFGHLDYYPKELFYKGYCLVRHSPFLIKSEDLIEVANISCNFFEFRHNCNDTNIFLVNVLGNALIPINNLFIDMILDHFWDSYKAITGC